MTAARSLVRLRLYLIRFCVAALPWTIQVATAENPRGTDPVENQAAVIAAACERATGFLVSLYDHKLRLLPEFAGHSVFWLYHDNYLAAKALDASHPELAAGIREAIRKEGVASSGKIEILYGEAELPLPFRHYDLMEVRRIENDQGTWVIRSEKVTEKEFRGWEEYADLLCMAALAKAVDDIVSARKYVHRALAQWDGHGLKDAATHAHGIYATYKLALLLLAAARCDVELPPAVSTVLMDRLLMQQSAQGGWITDYTEDGAPRGKANVETTCLVLLALSEAGRGSD